MQIETLRFGEVEVAEERILEFPEGLVGFPGLTRFLVIEDEKSAPFRWLQSLDEPGVAYVAVEPKWLLPEYRIDLTAGVAAQLGISQPDDMGILIIVTIPQDPREMTANLKGPLVYNTGSRRGTQLVIEDDRYPLQHRIITDEANSR